MKPKIAKAGLTLAVILQLFLSLVLVYYYDQTYLTLSLDSSSWFSVVHSKVNSYFLSFNIFDFFHIGSPVNYIMLTNVIFLFFSLVIFLKTFDGNFFYSNIAISVFLTTGVFILFGFDFVLWSCLALWPLLCVFVYKSLTIVDSVNAWRLSTILLIVTFICFSTQYGIYPLTIAILLAMSFKRDNLTIFPILRNKQDLVFIILCFVPWALFSFFAPLPDFPDYSALGHIVSDDGLPGNILPLFAPTVPIPIIDRVANKNILFPFSFVTFLLAVWLYLQTKKASTLFILLLSLLLILDTGVLEPIAQIAPLAVSQRLIPWQFFIPVNIQIFALLLLAIPLLNKLNKKSLLHTLLVSGALFWSPIVLKSKTYLNVNNQIALLYPPVNDALKRERNNLSVEPSYLNFIDAKLVSPSYAVLKKTGLWPLGISEIIKHWEFSSLLREKPIITSSHSGVEPLSNINDRDLATRWSPGGGKQNGDEWIYLIFREPLQLHGIELANGPFHTDFARGIEVFGGQHCPEKYVGDKKELTLLFSESEWQGSISMTDDMYPYFSGQGGGRIYFKSPHKLGCLLIRQTGRVSGYDWSIAELRVLKYPQ